MASFIVVHAIDHGGNEVNWEQAKGQWNQLKGSVRRQWGKLTDDDLDVVAGDYQRLIGRIQERYGINKEEAERQVSSWNPPIPASTKDVEQKRKVG